jgi:hypothetical protein
LKNDVSVPKLLRKRITASEQIQQAEHRNDKQLLHDGLPDINGMKIESPTRHEVLRV